jgi:hypothetical protein
MESSNQLNRRAGDLRRKSKSLLALAVLTASTSLLASECQAQTFAEWFSQKKTQQKYLLQQITALQLYSGNLNKGYRIASGGLGAVTKSLKDEFGLHTAYYNRLKEVNPALKDNPQLRDILAWQGDILQAVSQLNKADYLSQGERRYLAKVKDALLADCNQQIAVLQVLLTNGSLEMSDDERISRLNTIHLAMQSNHHFAADFTSRVKLYGVQKRREAESLSSTKKLWDIH